MNDADTTPPAEIVWGSISNILLRRAGTWIASREKSTDRATRLAAKAVADEVSYLAVHLRDLALADARARMAKADKAVTIVRTYWEGDPADAPEGDRA